MHYVLCPANDRSTWIHVFSLIRSDCFQHFRLLPVCCTLILWHYSITLSLLRVELSAAPLCTSLFSPAQPWLWGMLSYPPPLGTRWQLTVLYISMSGLLFFFFSFHMRLKMKINSSSVVYSELGTHLHLIFSQSHLHFCSFSPIFPPLSSWAICFSRLPNWSDIHRCADADQQFGSCLSNVETMPRLI